MSCYASLSQVKNVLESRGLLYLTLCADSLYHSLAGCHLRLEMTIQNLGPLCTISSSPGRRSHCSAQSVCLSGGGRRVELVGSTQLFVDKLTPVLLLSPLGVGATAACGTVLCRPNTWTLTRAPISYSLCIFWQGISLFLGFVTCEMEGPEIKTGSVCWIKV